MEQNKKDVISILSQIFSSNGEDKESWSDLLCSLISGDNENIQKAIIFLKQNLMIKEKVELTLDIIDFLITYGTQEIIEQIAHKDFLNCILVLLKNKSKSSVEVQKKVIFLTQKWHKKFENEENSKLIGFSENYNSLKKAGIIFPPENYNIQTYNNYISEEESQNSLMKASAIKKLTKESEEIKKSMGINFANPFSESDISSNFSNNNMCLDDEENENEIKNIPKKEEQNLDEENPYLKKEEKDEKSNSKNIFSMNDNNIIDDEKKNNNDNTKKDNNFDDKIHNNNIQETNNMSSYTNTGEENNIQNNEQNNVQNFSQEKNQQEQQEKYPKFPSRMSNLTNNNVNNNAYKLRNNPMNNQNNQFSNINNNYNNFNQNNNFKANNNYNNNYNNFSNNRNNYQNNNNYNNNYNSQGQNDYLIEAKTYKKLLGNKLLQLNAWINEGKYSFNSGRLKQGIQEILNEISICNNMMRNYQNKGEREAFGIIRNMRMDIEQTCSRYEDLMCDKNVQPFISTFQGNTRQYYYDTNRMFGIQQNYEMGNFDNYYKSSGLSTGNNYGNNNYNYKREETFGDKLSSFGNTVKDGLISFGKSVKNTAVSGYEYVKKKIDKDD